MTPKKQSGVGSFLNHNLSCSNNLPKHSHATLQYEGYLLVRTQAGLRNPSGRTHYWVVLWLASDLFVLVSISM